eukprot:ctg_536.g275
MRCRHVGAAAPRSIVQHLQPLAHRCPAMAASVSPAGARTEAPRPVAGAPCCPCGRLAAVGGAGALWRTLPRRGCVGAARSFRPRRQNWCRLRYRRGDGGGWRRPHRRSVQCGAVVRAGWLSASPPLDAGVPVVSAVALESLQRGVAVAIGATLAGRDTSSTRPGLLSFLLGCPRLARFVRQSQPGSVVAGGGGACRAPLGACRSTRWLSGALAHRAGVPSTQHHIARYRSKYSQ